ncbi:MAG: hypothetical protein GX974_08310, partial [Clostridiales bacterium]|nr:hypothetical protein [Clostridiales bacterium]
MEYDKNVNVIDSVDFNVNADLLLSTFRMEPKDDAAKRLVELVGIATKIGRPKAMYKEAIINYRGD